MPLILSSLFFIFSVVVFIFLYTKIQNNRVGTIDVFSTWNKEYQKKEEIKLLNDFLRDTIEQRAMLNSHFAQSSNAVSFLDMIEDLGSKVNAKAEVLVIDVPQDNTGLYVGIKTSGSFEAVYKFIKLLENSPYEIEIIFMDMSRGSFSSDSKQSFPWTVNLKIKLLSFIK